MWTIALDIHPVKVHMASPNVRFRHNVSLHNCCISRISHKQNLDTFSLLLEKPSALLIKEGVHSKRALKKRDFVHL